MSEKKKSGAGKGLAVFGVIILLLGAPSLFTECPSSIGISSN